VDVGGLVFLEQMELYIVNVPFDENNNSKVRPALVVEIKGKYITIFKITNQYINKSKNIKQAYYPIIDWIIAGLKQASYVDTHRTYNIRKTAIFKKQPIGKLTSTDVLGLYHFIQKNHSFKK
jgi:mRNA interferase MazF